MCKDGFTRNTADDGIHDNIEFNDYHTPEYRMKRRARRAIIDNLAPFGIVVGTLVAFLILGYIELGEF